MSRITIRNGELFGGYEPSGMPGAYIVTQFRVVDSQGVVPSEDIQWEGPGEWIISREGVPAGYRALWLGTRQTTRPFVVFVSDTPTRASDQYDRGYRRGWKAKRRPTISPDSAEAEIDGVMQGWRESPNNPRPGNWR